MKNRNIIIGTVSALLLGIGFYSWNKKRRLAKAEEERIKAEEEQQAKEAEEKAKREAQSAPRPVAAKPVETKPEPKKEEPKKSENGFAKGDKVYLKGEKIAFYSFPEFKGDYVKGTMQKRILLDRNVGFWVETANKEFDKIAVPFMIKLDGKTATFNPPMNVYVSKANISNKPY